MANESQNKGKGEKGKREVDNDKMLTPAEVCRIMEFSRSKLHLELATGGLPHFRMRALIRIRESDFVKWLATKKIQN